jgi:hypothetical protein
MAVIFISHSSKDDAHATAFERWLHQNGFTDTLTDHESIAGGDKWREALRAAANSCRVVMCLVTEAWLSSAECFNEFMAAWYMGRRIIPLMLLPSAVSSIDGACEVDPYVTGLVETAGSRSSARRHSLPIGDNGLQLSAVGGVQFDRVR